MNKQLSWELEIDHLMACNCNFGCPCSFEAPPTYETCEAALAYQVVEGHYDNISLNGLKWVLSAYWPGPLHERNGHGVVYLDENSKGEQREALKAIATGNAGGPIGIFMSTITAGLEVRVGVIGFHAAGKKSWFSVPEEVEVAFGPIRNPVSGEEHNASALLPDGMLAKKEDYYSADSFSVNSADNLRFEYPGRNALYFNHVWKGP
jgi:hypothetical protein